MHAGSIACSLTVSCNLQITIGQIFNFPSALQVIGDAAFYECIVLGSKMLALPETLVQIGASAFYRCSITSITIPVSVKNIGEAAFLGNKLSAMIPRKDAMFIGKIAFDNDSTVYGYPGTYVEQWCEANKNIVTFVPIKTQITLDGNGGMIHGGLTYGIEEVCGTFFANLPDGTAMARAGYIFAGWFTEREGGVAVTDNSTVATTDPFTLYAHWEVDTTPEKEKVTPSTTPSRITVKPALNKVQPLNKARIKVTWKKKRVKGANAIEIQYSTNKKFKGKAVYKKKVKLNQTNITLAKLKKKTTYYIRIRYVGTKTVSPWSSKIKVKTLKK